MATLESAQALPRDREANLALGAALVAVTAWASAFVGIRSAGHDLSPGSLALGRLLVGSLALGLLVAARRETFPGRRDLPAIALCGLLWFGAYNVLLNEAERRVDAGTAAMLVAVGPILIAIIAGFALREGFPRALLAGCLVAFVGVAVIGTATSTGGVDAGWGAALCIVAAFAYSLAVVVEKPVLARASALQVTWLACTVGAVACLPFAADLTHDLANADAAAIGWTVYLGTVPTAVGFVAWAYALSRTTAGRAGSITYLAPPIAVLLGWAILAETPPVLALAGGALCLVGVVIASGRLARSGSRASPADVDTVETR
jgi:drug/metabolite transporter (DMT)-like permease